ncbi:MAG: hypothetical protein HYV33_06420 [Candidatus Kerfeldbacteria bacterium]|nr:hypothetical protein [Candidatus Kerfeldbacteria bacterium]
MIEPIGPVGDRRPGTTPVESAENIRRKNDLIDLKRLHPGMMKDWTVILNDGRQGVIEMFVNNTGYVRVRFGEQSELVEPRSIDDAFTK